MKKIIFMALFVMILVCGVYGQTRAENRWILGRWMGTDSENRNYELVLNDNGTSTWTRPVSGEARTSNFLFSINGNELRLINDTGHGSFATFTIHRINDQRIVAVYSLGTIWINFSKRN